MMDMEDSVSTCETELCEIVSIIILHCTLKPSYLRPIVNTVWQLWLLLQHCHMLLEKNVAVVA